MKPQKLSRGKGTSMILYGVPGVGKTHLIGSGPRTLIIRPPTDHTDSIPLGADVEEIIIHDWSDQYEAFQWGQQGGFDDYVWVWLDGISLWEDQGLDDVFRAAIDRKPSREEFGPDKGEYGVNRSRLMKWMRDMVGLAEMGKINFGIVSHPFEWHDPVKEEDIWSPMVGSPNKPLTAKLCAMVNIVAYYQEVKTEDDGTQRLLLTDTAGFVGKDQLDAFPKLKSGRHGFVNPTMADIDGAIAKARHGTKRAKRRPARRRR